MRYINIYTHIYRYVCILYVKVCKTQVYMHTSFCLLCLFLHLKSLLVIAQKDRWKGRKRCEREGKIDRLLSRRHPPQPSPPFFLSLFPPPPPPLPLPNNLPPPTQADFPWSQRDQYSQCRWCTNHERWCTKEERTHSVSIMLSLQKSAGKNH